jgi:decaprenylphospho-beta-D-erythro-pentofuranosid-2-ulose 2-reductase
VRKIIILGALSAIGEATCRRLAKEGASLALFGRDAGRLKAVADDLKVRGAGGVHIFARDLAEAGDADAALAAASAAMGGADAVLLFYGVLGEQAKAETDPAHAAQLLQVNFTSAALWMLAGQRLLEKSHAPGRTTLLAVSSVAGDRGRRSNFIYGAAKGGLSILMQGLAHKSAGKGVRAVAVKLGFVDTPMTAGVAKGGPLWATADQAAAAIVRAMEKGGPIVYAPWFWRWIMLAVRATPAAIFNKVNL